MDLAFAFMAGYFALPFMWMMLITLVFIADVVLCETDNFGWGTTTILLGLGLTAWVGAGVNPFVWAWGNLGSIVEFLLIYFAIGGLWSIAKWYLYLLKVREKVKAGEWHSWTYNERYRDDTTDDERKNRRPEASYASNNVERIMGWIGHWPFSMIGSVFGDFLLRIVTNIYNVLSRLYEQIGDSVFSGFDSDEDD